MAHASSVIAQPAYIPALDALRGIAVLLVVARHASAVPAPENPIAAFLLETMRAGWMGVDLFFALSGFLITGILLDTKGTPGFLRNFYARRTLRIFPLYFTLLALLFFVGPLTPLVRNEEFQIVRENQGWIWSYLTNVLISWQGEQSVPFHLSHLWSLALEEQFYLVWPFVVLILPAKSILRACLVLSAAAVLLRVGIVASAGWGVDAAYMLMPARLDALLLGGALAWLVRSPVGRTRVRSLQRPVGFAALAVLLVTLAWRGSARNDPYMQVFGYAALSLVAVSLIAGALPQGGSKLLRRILSNRTMQSIGKYSYAIYIFQYPILLFLEHTVETYLVEWTNHSPLPVALALFVMASVLSIAAARVSWVVLEAPALSLKRFFPRRLAA
ncbi:MAG: acyltransferase [Gemmatimonadota bacterium]